MHTIITTKVRHSSTNVHQTSQIYHTDTLSIHQGFIQLILVLVAKNIMYVNYNDIYVLKTLNIEKTSNTKNGN